MLGFDTSTAYLTAALVADGAILGEREVDPDPTDRPRHARGLLGAVEGLLDDAGGWDSVERIAVGTGPGTFTGLRVGIATARALAQSRELAVCGVSSLRALAAGAEAPATLAVIDAKRNEVFAALYQRGSLAWGPWVGGPDALWEQLPQHGAPALAVGDGAVRFREELEASGAEVPPDPDPRHRIQARNTCLLGLSAEPVPLHEINPTYLRRPDAELWRERDRESTSTP